MAIHHNSSTLTDEKGGIVNIGGIVTDLKNIAPNPMGCNHQKTSQEYLQWLTRIIDHLVKNTSTCEKFLTKWL